LKFAGYEWLTLSCPVPCSLLPCPGAGQGKINFFYPALVQGRAGQGRVTLPCGHLWLYLKKLNFILFNLLPFRRKLAYL